MPRPRFPFVSFLLSLTANAYARDQPFLAFCILDFLHEKIEPSGHALSHHLPFANQPVYLFILASQFDSFALHRVFMFCDPFSGIGTQTKREDLSVLNLPARRHDVLIFIVGHLPTLAQVIIQSIEKRPVRFDT